MNFQFLSWAIVLGGLSAASLPLGSLLGLKWQPSGRVIGGMTAFGAGALIAALAVELVAPTAIHLVHAENAVAKNEASHHLINMLIGALVGGVLFVVLDSVVNSQGGFLRKTSATIEYFTNRKSARRKKILGHLASSELVRHLPLEIVEEMVTKVNERRFKVGDVLCEEGADGDEVFFIESGAVSISRGDKVIALLESGDVLGEIALVTGAPRTATAVAKKDTSALTFPKEDFDEWRSQSSEFEKAATALSASRLKELVERNDIDIDAEEWVDEAMSALMETTVVPTEIQLQQASEEHAGAPMAIWLGILLDGIPESFVIGSVLVVSIAAAVSQSGADSITLGSIFPYTLIAGLFLANFPEAMSSSIGMKKQGWKNSRIFLMWFSLMVMTAIGAGVGYWLGGNVDHGIVILIEGLAAGAMLTMIAAAMIPEAVHLGGSHVTGLSTLSGFLAAIAFKLLE
ncbi:MAG: cyclic nucleotide-binding domain-containing protein [Alphaproteobacteria bacterium]|jgi:CRP-like cAMP-binding protein|nr:cyclic nucleotide-binding domain-containing protein [Alphaproteobacteria bacterium]MBT4016404.1 cyclic nucleotide-binding domain-containing protein [Alphaproteobacteria bacterium]MBT4581372.1 cyclic nucleotide-binding domain-containing protein [Gammaproteobacteria bacterium]MBT4965048.1 cyclic nucleotide-binding domain-containing protein [Alphaproteobacteria bacterium]